MAVEIVDFPIKNGHFPLLNVNLPKGKVQALAISTRKKQLLDTGDFIGMDHSQPEPT